MCISGNIGHQSIIQLARRPGFSFSAHLLAHPSIKIDGRVEIIGHSPPFFPPPRNKANKLSWIDLL